MRIKHMNKTTVDRIVCSQNLQNLVLVKQTIGPLHIGGWSTSIKPMNKLTERPVQFAARTYRI